MGQLEDENGPQSAEDSSEVVPQPVGQLKEMLFSIPWGHHRYLIDRYGTEPEKAIFYVKKRGGVVMCFSTLWTQDYMNERARP